MGENLQFLYITKLILLQPIKNEETAGHGHITKSNLALREWYFQQKADGCTLTSKSLLEYSKSWIPAFAGWTIAPYP